MQSDDVALIFDLDGVLVASGPAHAASWRLVARKHGIQVSDEQFRDLFGRTSRDIVRVLWGPALSDDQVRAIDDEKEATYRELITGVVPLTIGAREILKPLRSAGFRLAVASSAPPENVELVLREGGIERNFSAVVTGVDVSNGKPAPDCFLLAAQRLGCPPTRCAVVEDAPVGIQAALAAGMAPVGFVGTHPAERLQEAGARAIVRELSELTPEFLRKVLGD